VCTTLWTNLDFRERELLAQASSGTIAKIEQMTMSLQLLSASRESLCTIEPTLRFVLVGIVTPQRTHLIDSGDRHNDCGASCDENLVRDGTIWKCEWMTQGNHVVLGGLKVRASVKDTDSSRE
jgi:hypothetical protein